MDVFLLLPLFQIHGHCDNVWIYGDSIMLQGVTQDIYWLDFWQCQWLLSMER